MFVLEYVELVLLFVCIVEFAVTFKGTVLLTSSAPGIANAESVTVISPVVLFSALFNEYIPATIPIAKAIITKIIINSLTVELLKILLVSIGSSSCSGAAYSSTKSSYNSSFFSFFSIISDGSKPISSCSLDTASVLPSFLS